MMEGSAKFAVRLSNMELEARTGYWKFAGRVVYIRGFAPDPF